MIIGIDPGKSGGIAVLSNDGTWYGGFRMPIMKHGKRDLVNIAAIDKRIVSFAEETLETVNMIVLEQVHAMPGQGVSSMFNFGRHTGAVEGWAINMRCPMRWVTPQMWKKFFSLEKSKTAALDRARLEFGENNLWTVKANDGIAEAALIALWHIRSSK